MLYAYQFFLSARKIEGLTTFAATLRRSHLSVLLCTFRYKAWQRRWMMISSAIAPQVNAKL